MNRLSIETGVGIFIILGFICMAYLSIKLGDVEFFGTKQYPVKATFTNISGLKEGSEVISQGKGRESRKISSITITRPWSC
jgi:phospholipid/cholesterol/gamma-HCH transport system substrate-binding protein